MIWKKCGRICLAFIVLASVLLAPVMTDDADAHAPRKLSYGSENGDVWDLQYRLRLLGYYKLKLDGQFGIHTSQAVKRFQRDYGLKVDGIVGPATWRTLKKVSLSLNEVEWVARAVHGEARGESYAGKVAVAAVIMNRIASDQFPNTAKGVIFEPGAFTAVDDGQIWLTPDDEARLAVRDAVRGWDPTHGSLYYFNPETATSPWIWGRPQTVQIGKHIFAH
ncbi:spore cortex-lytic enzyme [Novibacillus thermophilus]|uniref:Spore cortex-lytic enzyme n=1 Tax=Novibacillus thermophilus TaxID=1471761 RepID=A0A1U9K4Z9_9BACL|nr:spore cortex-lytic enzyme [Novibacillus thermophilus]